MHFSCEISLTSIITISKKIHAKFLKVTRKEVTQRVRRSLVFDDSGEIGIDLIFKKTMKYHTRWSLLLRNMK